MKTITLHIPDSANIEDKDVAIFLAAKLYESGRLSLGQAADLAKIDKLKFTNLLGGQGVSIFNYPAEDLIDDIQNA